MIFNRKEHHIFFDFGHRFAKMCHLVRQNQSFTVDSYCIKPIPDELFKGFTPQNPLSFKELVYELISDIPESIQNKSQFHLTAPDAHTILKKLNLPKPLPKNMGQHMLYEAEQLSPYPLEDALLDYDFLDQDPLFTSNEAENLVPILITIAKKSHIQPYIQLFEDIDFQLDVATPASVGLMTIGLRLLHSRKTPGPIILAHLGDTASLLVYVSRQAFRFCYHPRGFTKVIHETIKHCDLQFTEGRYFAEHLNEKNMPDIFMASFNNNLTRYIESLGNQMVQLANHQNNDKITILLSGGPTRVANMLPCFKRFPELDVQHLDFNTHLMNNKLVLEKGIDPHALATFSPHFVGYMESMGL